MPTPSSAQVKLKSTRPSSMSSSPAATLSSLPASLNLMALSAMLERTRPR